LFSYVSVLGASTTETGHEMSKMGDWKLKRINWKEHNEEINLINDKDVPVIN
jgi:uncharacterized membrane protein